MFSCINTPIEPKMWTWGQFVASIYEVGSAAADKLKYVYFRFNSRQIGFPILPVTCHNISAINIVMTDLENIGIAVET